jgi:hypothetical protein
MSGQVNFPKKDSSEIQNPPTDYVGLWFDASGIGYTRDSTGTDTPISTIVPGSITASDVVNVPVTGISATDVQAAINELNAEKQPADADLTTISALTPADDDILQRKAGSWTNRTVAQYKADLAYTAAQITNTPAGNISATNVQAAINELDTEKAALASPTFTGTPAAPTAAPATSTTQLATTAFVQQENATKVTGPSSATDNAIARFDGTTGKLIQNSLVTITDVGTMIFPSITEQASTPGQLQYNSTEDCLNFHPSSAAVSQQLGQELWTPKVKNTTGSSIPDGTQVYINNVSSGLPTIALARADSLSTCRRIYITTQTIANNGTGFCTNFGIIHNLNTSSWVPGTALYLSASVAGTFTTTVPIYPNYQVLSAIVLTQDATAGSVIWHPATPLIDDARNARLVGRNLTPGTGTNTTGEELLQSIQVAANLVMTGDLLDVFGSIAVNSSAGTKIFRMYVNTSASLSGATLIATSATFTSNSTGIAFTRKFPVISDTALECMQGATGAVNTWANASTGVSVNITVPSVSAGFFVIISGQKNTGTDTDSIRWAAVQNSRL